MITGLDHATIITNKLDETRDFFVDAFGLEVGKRPDFGVPGFWLYGGGRPILHLAAVGKDRPAAGMIDHFSFATDDFAGALARLDKLGVKYQAQPIPDGMGAQAFCHDPNGVLIEITCRAPVPAPVT
ncbi:MAG: glyoxalase/Bleomycin resistance/Dioxygenase superfamily protein [Caulobacteraceae bacterium]|nr:glyoxalase/Bleomycin resistance/Dioxygenase superfamily protein [Caulobacteraceae bacterium]